LGGLKKLVVGIGVAIVLAYCGLVLAIGVLVRSVWFFLAYLPVVAFVLYFLYVRLWQKKEAQYPMVPPEGKTDIYFPRTDIPRPFHAEFRKMEEMEEKRRKLAKMKKKRHKKR